MEVDILHAPVFALGGWSVQQCPSCLPDEMFSVWHGDIRVAHRLHRYDAETLVRVVVGALVEARRQAIEECARAVEASSMNLLVEWGATGIIVERQRNDLADKIRAIPPPTTEA